MDYEAVATQYEKLLEDAVLELPTNPSTLRAFVALAQTIVLEQALDEFLDVDGTISTPDADRLTVVRMLEPVSLYLADRHKNDLLTAERARAGRS